MFIPEIHPDEFSPGYLIRLGLINGMASEKKIIEEIIREFSIETDQENLIAYQLSKVTGMRLEDYCQHHTLLPLHNCVSKSGDALPHGSVQDAYTVFRHGHKGLVKNFKVCKSCLEEDIAYWGYGYYRRSHQFPGIRYCTKHGNSASGALYSVDSKIFLNADQLPKKMLKKVKQYKEHTIIKYHQLVDEICQLTVPVKATQLVTSLQVQANLKGLSWGNVKTSQRVLFSDLVLKTLPTEWAEELFANFDSKVVGKRYGGVDGLLSPQKKPFKSASYILALAVLFDDPDMALLALINSGDSADRVIRQTKRYGDEFWQSKEFLNVYIKNVGQVVNIAKELGIDTRVVSKGLRFANFPVLGSKGKKVIRAYNKFLSGLGLIQCLSETKVNPNDLEALIRINLNGLALH